MKITCQSCQSKYNVADEKVQGKIVKIRCRKCGATIVVNGTEGDAATTNGAPAEAPAAAAIGEGQWHVNVSDTEQRSMSLAELVDAYNAGTVNPETFIWTDGMEDWKPLGEVEVVVAALHTSAPAVAAAAPAPAMAMDPPAAAPVSAPMQAAASESKRAAVKREARGRDLFGTSDDVQTSASASPGGLSSAVDDGKLTGQRNESSVLFSLAVLTKSADPAPAAQPARNNREDSGLIDLKALAAKAESMRPAAPAQDIFSTPLGAAPLPFGAPLGVVPLGDEAHGKSKLPLIIALGLGAIVLLALGVVIGVKLLAPPAAAPVATAVPSAPAMSAAEARPSATAAAPTFAETTAPSATAATTATAATAVASKGHGLGGAGAAGAVGGVHSGGGVKQQAAAPTAAAPGPAPAPAPAPAPKPKAGHDCGCNGDLMCLMQCSTK